MDRKIQKYMYWYYLTNVYHIPSACTNGAHNEWRQWCARYPSGAAVHYSRWYIDRNTGTTLYCCSIVSWRVCCRINYHWKYTARGQWQRSAGCRHVYKAIGHYRSLRLAADAARLVPHVTVTSYYYYYYYCTGTIFFIY